MMMHTGYYVLAGDDQSPEEIIRCIIPEFRKWYLRAGQDLNVEQVKWRGLVNETNEPYYGLSQIL